MVGGEFQPGVAPEIVDFAREPDGVDVIDRGDVHHGDEVVANAIHVNVIFKDVGQGGDAWDSAGGNLLFQFEQGKGGRNDVHPIIRGSGLGGDVVSHTFEPEAGKSAFGDLVWTCFLYNEVVRVIFALEIDEDLLPPGCLLPGIFALPALVFDRRPNLIEICPGSGIVFSCELVEVGCVVVGLRPVELREDRHGRRQNDHVEAACG